MEGKPTKEAAEPRGDLKGDQRKGSKERRGGEERRKKDQGPPAGRGDLRLADRRVGLDRRRPHLHYEELTQHPRPERNINDYPLSTDELEFINAINDYKSKFARPFPTWSEILHVLRTLGYIRLDADLPLPPGVSLEAPVGGPPAGESPPKEGP
jgi:hypothetical protein